MATTPCGYLQLTINLAVPDDQLLIYILAGTTTFFALLALILFIRNSNSRARLNEKITQLDTRREQGTQESDRLQSELDSTRGALDSLSEIRFLNFYSNRLAFWYVGLN